MRESMRIGTRNFDLNAHTYVMGILNVTPDSFFDGGKWRRMEDALFHVEKMCTEGMDILDIGGESTRPGYEPVSWQEEMERILPVVEMVKSRFDIPISVDTCKSEVAQAAIRSGADLINDTQGLKGDDRMAEVIARAGIPCVLMHNRSKTDSGDLPGEVYKELQESITLARGAGIEERKIILDPGIGFGKTREQNLQLIRELDRFSGLKRPLLLGASRKSVIGLTLNLPVEERLEGTLVTTVFAVIKGCSFVRVHDVKENVRAVQMAQAILAGC